MSLGRTLAVGLRGIDGFMVDIEADIAPGLPHIAMSGRADPACAQAPNRVRAAASHCEVPIPQRRITLNLSPAAIPKVGAGFDLAIAVAILAAAEVLADSVVRSVVHLGELGLDGTVRPVRGTLPLIRAAALAGCRHAVVPVANAAEARLVSGIDVHPVAHLRELVQRYQALADGLPVSEVAVDDLALRDLPDRQARDMSEVVGQPMARWALEVAAAGNHHMSMLGPPGTGKTMLAERLPTILPDLDTEAAEEVTAIASVLSTTSTSTSVLRRRPPFVAPHHSASMPAIVGGGAADVRPGAVTAAHRGVLFLDEAPEFGTKVLQSLRQPLESGSVTIARARGVLQFPARFQLILAANPCPCGLGSGKGEHCRCSPLDRRRYAARLGGPLLDRIDLRVEVLAPTTAVLTAPPGESSAQIAARVGRARAAQQSRLQPFGWATNSEVTGSALRGRTLRLGPSTTREIDVALRTRRLSLRGYHRCLRVAWTLADLAERDAPTADDIDQAYALRARSEAA